MTCDVQHVPPGPPGQQTPFALETAGPEKEKQILEPKISFSTMTKTAFSNKTLNPCDSMVVHTAIDFRLANEFACD